MNITARELSSIRTDFEAKLVDTCYIYEPPNPNTAARNSRGEISQKYPDAWLSIIGGVSITAGHAGTGYTANDIVTLVGGLATVKILTVAAITGAVLTIQLVTADSYATGSYAVTGGTGTGLKVTVTPKTYPFRADELKMRDTEEAGAGQVQSITRYELCFESIAPVTAASRIKAVTSQNPDLVGTTFDVMASPQSTTEILHTAICTVTQASGSNPR